MAKLPPETEWEKQRQSCFKRWRRADCVANSGGSLVARQAAAWISVSLCPTRAQEPVKCSSMLSHREINFERLTCCQFAQLLTQMRQLVG
jgi:hypothetical protein